MKNIILSILLCLATTFCRADVHHVKLYINVAFLATDNVASIAHKFTKYVDICNYTLAKNTSQAFYFNGPLDVIVVDDTDKFYDGQISRTNQVAGYDYWIDVHKVTNPLGVSCCGYNSADLKTGAAVCAGTQWTKIYDWDLIQDNSEDLNDCWRQVNVMLHEFGHSVGAALGEYYTIAMVNDLSGVSPINNINVNSLTDSYYVNHTDLYTDPMLMTVFGQLPTGLITTKVGLLNAVKYGKLTSAIMNGGYRLTVNWPPNGNINRIMFHVVDRNGIPLDKTHLKIFNRSGMELIYDKTDSYGNYYYNWENENGDYMKTDNARLIKIFPAGVGYKNTARWTSFWEIQEDWIANGNHGQWFIKTIVVDQ